MKKYFTIKRKWSVDTDKDWKDFSKYIGMDANIITMQKIVVKENVKTEPHLKKLILQYNKKKETDLEIL